MERSSWLGMEFCGYVSGNTLQAREAGLAPAAGEDGRVQESSTPQDHTGWTLVPGDNWCVARSSATWYRLNLIGVLTRAAGMRKEGRVHTSDGGPCGRSVGTPAANRGCEQVSREEPGSRLQYKTDVQTVAWLALVAIPDTVPDPSHTRAPHRRIEHSFHVVEVCREH